MLSNNRISFVKSLQQKKYRAEEGMFVAEGDKLVREYLQSSFEIDSVYGSTDWLQRHGKLIGSSTQSAGAAAKDLERMSSLVTAPEVLAVVKVPQYNIPVSQLFKGITLVLDGIRDPGNMGTIIRTADWFGVHRIIASDDCAEHWNPKVVQASMGSLTRVKILNRELVTFFGELNGYASANALSVPPVYGTFMDGENVYSAPLSKDGMIVIGNEANGIRDTTMEFISSKISIPSFSTAAQKPESLNAAIAAALVLAEFCRR
jgi:TrmH family RNA methyltransferase